jgi:prepilin-type N-terminal cleavage/methylation domain-containing protein
MALKRALQLQEKRAMQEAVRKNRKGFTLVELVVALVVFIVIITISFSALSRFFAMRSAQEQEMILQQNFRFVLDKMAYDFRQANIDTTSTDPMLIRPSDNAMGDKLAFTRYESGTTTDIYYFIKPHGDSYALYREEYTHGDTPEADTPISSQPVTEDMHQLVKVYFVRAGGKVIMIVVGNLEYFGKERTISFTSLVFSRNSPNE